MTEQELSHERLRVERRELPREALEYRHVDPQLAQRREPIVQRLDDGRCPLRRDDRQRVGLEGEDDRLPTVGARPLDRGAQDRLMAEMYPVEVSERQHRPAERPRHARKVADYAHHRHLYPTVSGL